MIAAIRNIRGENRINPGAKINVRLAPNDDQVQKILGTNRNAIVTLGRIEQLEIQAEGNLAKCAVTLVTIKDARVKVIIPLEGLVDLAEEITRIQKTIEKLDREITTLTARLANENFVKNAAEEVVETDRGLLGEASSKIGSLREALTRLQS